MGPKTVKEQPTDMDTTRTEFIAKLSTAAEAMRQFGNFADALAKVVAKAPLDDPQVVEALQTAIDAIPAATKKRKLTTLGAGEEGGKRRRREKKPKDPNAPKAPPSAYILFQNEIRNVVRDQNPNIQYRDLMGLISQQWNTLPSEKKQPYFDRVTAAKITHEEEMAKYNALNPNHVPSEGTSSKTTRKEVQPAAKPEKKGAAKSAKHAPKSAETAPSSEDERSSEEETSEEEREEGDVDKASDEASEMTDEEPTPPPAKKAKRAEKKK